MKLTEIYKWICLERALNTHNGFSRFDSVCWFCSVVKWYSLLSIASKRIGCSSRKENVFRVQYLNFVTFIGFPCFSTFLHEIQQTENGALKRADQNQEKRWIDEAVELFENLTDNLDSSQSQETVALAVLVIRIGVVNEKVFSSVIDVAFTDHHITRIQSFLVNVQYKHYVNIQQQDGQVANYPCQEEYNERPSQGNFAGILLWRRPESLDYIDIEQTREEHNRHETDKFGRYGNFFVNKAVAARVEFLHVVQSSVWVYRTYRNLF